MADPGIKKVIVPKSLLPAVNKDNEYIVRFRIVSENRNRISDWSKKFLVSASEVISADADFLIAGRVVTIVWNDPDKRPAYDIFVASDTSSFVFNGSSVSSTYSFINQATTTFKYAIQIQSIDKVYTPALVIYESNVIPIPPAS